jgi:hypothetical protein
MFKTSYCSLDNLKDGEREVEALRKALNHIKYMTIFGETQTQTKDAGVEGGKS